MEDKSKISIALLNFASGDIIDDAVAKGRIVVSQQDQAAIPHSAARNGLTQGVSNLSVRSHSRTEMVDNNYLEFNCLPQGSGGHLRMAGTDSGGSGDGDETDATCPSEQDCRPSDACPPPETLRCSDSDTDGCQGDATEVCGGGESIEVYGVCEDDNSKIDKTGGVEAISRQQAYLKRAGRDVFI